MCGSYIDIDEQLAESRHNREIEGMIGSSQAICGVLDQIRIVAPTDATVLIDGETGTGKELIACAIHTLSGRRNRPFVKLNCGVIPVGRSSGDFEAANGGTLFLDEIADIPLEAQSELLRVLQQQEFERLGGAHCHRMDVRVVAATNQDLAPMVAEKRFRMELYYRLNIFPISLPPLRVRRGDIPILAAHFVRKFAERMSKQISRIPQTAMDTLIQYPWPGNIRELQNFIERAVILTTGGILQMPPFPAQTLIRPEPATLEEVERNHILKALEQSNWIVGGKFGAAARLGMARTTLIGKMQRRGLSRELAQGRSGLFAKEAEPGTTRCFPVGNPGGNGQLNLRSGSGLAPEI
jgi:formate hydrogenlyase transcriptional activator